MLTLSLSSETIVATKTKARRRTASAAPKCGTGWIREPTT
jgi:hypothetical protein